MQPHRIQLVQMLNSGANAASKGGALMNKLSLLTSGIALCVATSAFANADLVDQMNNPAQASRQRWPAPARGSPPAQRGSHTGWATTT